MENTLATAWFFIWGLLWAVFFVLDGFDLGVGILLPFLARNPEQRRQLHTAIGPFWDGNEVWLITAGGVTFAAFPATYAVMFSALYSPLMLILFALILRGAAIAFRPEVDSPPAKTACDYLFFISSAAAALLLGVAFANIFAGVPIGKDGLFQGSLPALLTPYGLLGGLLFLALFSLHGAIWTALKTDGIVARRAEAAAWGIWILTLLAAVAFLALSAVATHLYDNYRAAPPLFIVPAIAVLALLAVPIFLKKHAWARAWTASAILIAAAAAFGVIGIYPALLPSSIHPQYSMTIANSASTPLTLKIMLAVVLAIVPIVILYQAWAYRLFRGKTTPLLDEDQGMY